MKFSQNYLLILFQLPLLASTSGDILEVFLVKHSLVCNQLGRFSFSSKTFRSEDKNQRSTSPSRQQFLGQVTQVVSFWSRCYIVILGMTLFFFRQFTFSNFYLDCFSLFLFVLLFPFQLGLLFLFSSFISFLDVYFAQIAIWS